MKNQKFRIKVNGSESGREYDTYSLLAALRKALVMEPDKPLGTSKGESLTIQVEVLS